MEYTREQLKQAGFNQARLTNDTYLGLQFDSGAFLLARRLDEEIYYIHGARDANLNKYTEDELSDAGLENSSLEELMDFVKNPDSFLVRSG